MMRRRTIDPMVIRIHSLRDTLSVLLRRLEKRYRKNSACLDNLRNYNEKNLFVRVRYYFLNKNKENNEKLIEIKNDEIREILDDIEKLITKVAHKA